MPALKIYVPDERPPRQPRQGRPLPHFLWDAEFDLLLAHLDAAARRVQRFRSRYFEFIGRRDRVTAYFGLFCGLRVQEICDLTRPQFDLEKGTVFVHGKGAVDRVLPIPSRALPVFRDWIDGLKEARLFYGERNGPLTQDAVRLRCYEWGKAIGLTRFRLHPHALRHTYATRLLDKGASIREVQFLLGHSSLQATSHYVHCVPGKARDAVERL